MVLEKTPESPLDCKEVSNQSILKEISCEYSLNGLMAEAEAPVLWPPDAKSKLVGKDSDAGKIEGRRRRGSHRMRWLDGIIDSMGMSLSISRRWWRKRALVCCSPWGCKESDTTEWLNNIIKAMVKIPHLSRNCVWFWFCLEFFVWARTYLIDMPLKFLIYGFCYSFFFLEIFWLKKVRYLSFRVFNILGFVYCLWLMLLKVILLVLGRTLHRWWCVLPVE